MDSFKSLSAARRIGDTLRLTSTYQISETIRRLTHTPAFDAFQSVDWIRDPQLGAAASAIEQFSKLQDQFQLGAVTASASQFSALGKAAALLDIGSTIRNLESHLSVPFFQNEALIKQLQVGSAHTTALQQFTAQVGEISVAIHAFKRAQQHLTDTWGTLGLDPSAFDEVDEATAIEAELSVAAITRNAEAELTLEDAVNKVIDAIKEQKRAGVRAVLLIIFIMVLEGVIQNAIGFAINTYAPRLLEGAKSPQGATKIINEVAQQTVGSAVLVADYRFVSCKILVVRQNPRARSPEIGRLRLGMAVRLLKTKKAFALVVWSDQETGVEIQGWVFARYLRKFQ